MKSTESISKKNLIVHYLKETTIQYSILTNGIIADSISALRDYGTTGLRHYGITALRHYGISALRHYGFTALRLYDITTLRLYGSRQLRQKIRQCRNRINL